jgi:hypothetical protein
MLAITGRWAAFAVHARVVRRIALRMSDAVDDGPSEAERPIPAIGWRGERVHPTQQWGWVAEGAEHVLVDGKSQPRARIIADGSGWTVVWPKAIPRPRADAVDDAKAKALSLALSALPLDKATAARVREQERDLERAMADDAASIAGVNGGTVIRTPLRPVA